MWLGDFADNATLHFLWSTQGADGASITRAVDGEVRVYKDNGVAQSTAGVTDTEDFDGLTGVHACTIDLSAHAFYAPGSNYTVALEAATIDGEVVNTPLAHFSIENRFDNAAAIADAIFRMTTATIEGVATPSHRTLYGVIAALMHLHERNAADTTIILYESDDSTPLVEIPITKKGGLEPIQKVDPPA